MQEQIDKIHALWDQEDRFEAVRLYKQLLRSDQIRWDWSELNPDLTTIYRRVIEHEAEYGDPGSARDWCLRAYDQGQWSTYSTLRQLTFSSENARQIWLEVVSASEGNDRSTYDDAAKIREAYDRGRQTIQDAYERGRSNVSGR